MIEDLYSRYGAMVYRRCLKLLKNESDALDATQDVFVQALRYRQTIRENTAFSYLLKITTNVCLNRIRAHKRSTANHDDNADDILDKLVSVIDIESQVMAERFKHFIFRDHLKTTEVIATLLLVDGLTLQEVANEVGLSVSGVRKRMRRLQAHIDQIRESINEK